MNLKDYTLKLTYVADGAISELTADCAELNGGFENEDISLAEVGGLNEIRINLCAKKPLTLKAAELIYDHYFETNEKFFANGFQSWTLTREYGHGDLQKGLAPICKLPKAREFAGASGDYYFTRYGKNLYHSFTYTYLRHGGSVELLGSLNERTGYTVFYADMSENLLCAVKDVEGAEVNGEYELFNFIRTFGNYDQAFDAYFEAYPLKHTGRVNHFAGYTSWYNYYQNIDEKIILRDLEGLKRVDNANIFQIDDGYETMVGDWTIDEKKFPNGLLPIVEKIHAQGLKAGLWCAPFSAQFKANIVKERPEWFICGKNGKPLISGMAWGGFYALDFEIEEVREYVRALFDKIFNEWGFDMVKLDFLYCAAIYPRNGKSRGQLMCEALDFLRECCGDKLFLGCGVPLGPAFGIVDACRIGCDAETSYKNKFYVGITNQEIISTQNAMTDAVFRRHLNGRIFANDPDVFFLRNGGVKPAKYTLEQKKLLAKLNNMFGSVLFVSDYIGDYDDAQLEILNESYKPFEGKVKRAEYVGADCIQILYLLNGEEYTLKYNVSTGEYSDKRKEK
ncbi:MAG: alpha-galactosidase [Bacteroides sp.]|nr:alpha-galactosidase [Bacillota bacterium]MCM1393450.1 alpha-galactosidase [[Eubacterium] siraeum]MCM1455050.1 alpha-galactosidase [Bacteroides sp.]